MTNQEKYTAMMKAQSAAGLKLRHGIDAMLSLIEDSKAKEEMQRLIQQHIDECAEARKQGDGFEKWSESPMR